MDQPVSTTSPALALVPVAMLAWVPVAASGQDMRDPMMPPQAAAHSGATGVAGAPQLTAILQGEGGRVAVFNGEFVRGGERVGDCLILAVLADGVRYRRGERVLELHLPANGPSYFKPAAPLPGLPRGVDP
jgi:hypothetical protein